MDSTFISTLSDEELTRLTPTIFDTLQNIIQTQEKPLNLIKQCSVQAGKAIRAQDVIFYLQFLQTITNTGTVIVEMDGYGGHLFHVVMPNDIPQLLGVPLAQCNIHVLPNDESLLIIDPPAGYDWEIAIIILTDQIRQIFKDWLE